MMTPERLAEIELCGNDADELWVKDAIMELLAEVKRLRALSFANPKFGNMVYLEGRPEDGGW